VRVLPIQNETNVRLLGEDLLHAVEGAAGLEPLDLGLVEGVVERDVELGAVGLGDDGLQGLQHTRRVDSSRLQSRKHRTNLASLEGGETNNGDLVALGDLVVVSTVGEGEGEQTCGP
jgi:hypothetical protein